MITFPNAKINLGLRVVSKRSDGYHNLETVFYPVPLSDALEIIPAAEKEDKLIISGMFIDGSTEDNLVVKALELLRNDFVIPPLEIYLRKKIPLGAGLGGGSADAAFMLKLLNDFCQLQLSEEQLEDYAVRLGADCPFFIKNEPVFAQGIGNEFSPVDINLQGYRIFIVKPDIFVSTKEAYDDVKPQASTVFLKEIIQLPVKKWKNYLINDFEKSIFPKYPKIEQIKNALYDQGAVYASMSGSGSAVFGLFDSPISESMDSFADCQCYSGVF